MDNYKLFELLSVFTEKELKELGDFIKLPSVNNGRDLTKFYNLIKKYYPDFNSKLCSRENIYSQLYPNRPFKDHIIRNLQSALFNITKQYLSLKNLKKNTAALNRYFIRELIERNASKIAQTELNKQNKLLSDVKNNVDNYFEEKSLLQNMNIMNNISSENIAVISESIKKNIELKIYDFLQSISIIMVNILNYKDNYNLDFSGNLLEHFLNDFNLKKFINILGHHRFSFENPEIAEIYCCLILTINDIKDEYYYSKLKNLILKNINYFSRIEKYNLLIVLSTCTSMKSVTVNREKYLNELFEVYRLRYSSGLYAFSDYSPMSVTFFYSAIRLGIACNELQWAEDFINTASYKLPEKEQMIMKNFALAELNFAKNNFKDAFSYLSKIQFKNIAFNYEVRALQLQIYYELGEIDAAEYALDSFKHFLRNNKSVSDYFRVNSEEFISIYTKLVKSRMSGKNNLHPKLKKEINNCKLPQRDWFSEKLRELVSSEESK